MRAVVSSNSAKRRTTIAIAAVSESEAISVQKKRRFPSESSVRASYAAMPAAFDGARHPFRARRSSYPSGGGKEVTR